MKIFAHFLIFIIITLFSAKVNTGARIYHGNSTCFVSTLNYSLCDKGKKQGNNYHKKRDKLYDLGRRQKVRPPSKVAGVEGAEPLIAARKQRNPLTYLY